MSTVYRCPNCKTNKTRFNLLEQIVHPVKKDPQTGEIIHEYNKNLLEPYHLPYNGPTLRVQCATCGLIEDEKSFTAYGNI